jgi:SAM-dependent methyltransferase
VPVSATDYTPTFYDQIADGCRRSAAVVVPLVLDRLRDILVVPTVVDVGCGQGWWGAELATHGCDVVGLDGGYVDDRQVPFIEADLAEPLPSIGTFDLAVCLEVAEHLPKARAAGFVADLCVLAPVVLFSAAVPHQSGAGHINLQWPSWWAALFAEHGYVCDPSLRWAIWDDDNVEPWYRQNLMVVSRDAAPVGPLDVVHPVIHEWGRS